MMMLIKVVKSIYEMSFVRQGKVSCLLAGPWKEGSTPLRHEGTRGEASPRNASLMTSIVNGHRKAIEERRNRRADQVMQKSSCFSL